MRSKLDVLGFKAPSKSQSWVHHSKDQARLEKLSEEELEEYIKLLERLFPDDDSDAEGGELSGEAANGGVVREIAPYRHGRS